MMYNNFNGGFERGFGDGMMDGGFGLFPIFGLAVAFFMLWSIFWKGLALWHSARRNQPVWFIVLLVVNTLGILEIIYLFFVLKMKFKELFGKSHAQETETKHE